MNAVAGGGSLLTIPLLHAFIGLPGTLANGTNRVGVTLQSAASVWGYWREGASGVQQAAPLLLPVATGALLGAYGGINLPDVYFERSFGVMMLLLLVPMWRGHRVSRRKTRRPLHPAWRALLFFGIGLYGGLFQAGVGLLLISAISWSGEDLLTTNSMKVAINLCFTLLVLPIFVLADLVVWSYALALGAGYAVGGALGARFAVRGGERLLRPAFVAAVLLLSGNMLGLY